MKTNSVYISLLFFFILLSGKAQVRTGTDPRFTTTYAHHLKTNYICDSLLKVYTNYWSDWWKELKIKGDIPGHKPPAHFDIPYADLKYLDSLGRAKLIPDSVEAYFAFNSTTDYQNNQITAVIYPLVDSLTFNSGIKRWKDWCKQHNLKKEDRPVGFKIRFADLDSMYQLLSDPNNPMLGLKGYLVFHSKHDKKKNRISVVFRPTFYEFQKKVDNDKVNCGGTVNRAIPTGTPTVQKSFINIDFTNPCPPCDGSG